MKELITILRNREGSEMVEAPIVMPIIILTAMLLLRLFVFYLDILASSVRLHKQALKAWDEYSSSAISEYSESEERHLLAGGMLGSNLSKTIRAELFMCNEDALVRLGELFEK